MKKYIFCLLPIFIASIATSCLYRAPTGDDIDTVPSAKSDDAKRKNEAAKAEREAAAAKNKMHPKKLPKQQEGLYPSCH